MLFPSSDTAIGASGSLSCTIGLMDDADRVEVVVVAVATAVLTAPAATTTIIVANATRYAAVTMRLFFFLFLLRCLISLSSMKIMDKRLPLRGKGKTSHRSHIIIIVPILGDNEGKDHDYE